jgi:hypothetical protein
LCGEFLSDRRGFDGDLEEVKFFEDQSVEAAGEIVAVDEFAFCRAFNEELRIRLGKSR